MRGQGILWWHGFGLEFPIRSSTVFAEAIRLGTAPAAIVLAEPDPILVIGGIVARPLYGLACPVIRIATDPDDPRRALVRPTPVRNAGGDMTGSDTILLAGDLPIWRIGFGAMRITGRGVWGPPPDRPAAIALLRRVVELGINFIDTADSYGPDVSEALIAEALHPYPPGLVIATKGGMVRAGPWAWSIDGRPRHLRACVEGSLRKLRTETIDLYQLHRPDPKIPIEDSLGTLAALQAEGKIRHIGVCNVTGTMLRRAQAAVGIVSVQNHHNLIDRTDGAVLETCGRDGLVFFAYFPLGDVGDGSGPALVAAEPASPQAIVAARHDATPAEVALAWMIRTLPFAVPIPGTSSEKHLEENIGALALAAELTDDDLTLLATIETAAGVY